MIDENLIALLKKDKKYIFGIVIFHFFDLIINLTFSLSICFVVEIFLKECAFFSFFAVPMALVCTSLAFCFVDFVLIGRNTW